MPDYMKPARGRQAEGRQGRRYAAMRRNPQWFARQAAFTDKNFVFLQAACISGLHRRVPGVRYLHRRFNDQLAGD
jgi:hypothetical protein